MILFKSTKFIAKISKLQTYQSFSGFHNKSQHIRRFVIQKTYLIKVIFK